MGKHIHRLSNLDKDLKTATCKACGPVAVYLQPSRDTWICLPAKIAVSQTPTSREARKRSIKAWRKTPKGIACVAKAKNKSRDKSRQRPQRVTASASRKGPKTRARESQGLPLR